MSDVLERLKNRLPPNDPSERGIVSVFDAPEFCRDLRDAIAEITYLRSVAGAVSDGPSMMVIKNQWGKYMAWGPSGPMTQEEYDAYVANATLQPLKHP